MFMFIKSVPTFERYFELENRRGFGGINIKYAGIEQYVDRLGAF